MLVLSSSDGISSVHPSQSYYSGNNTNINAQSQSVQGNFDQLNFSPEPVGEHRFQLELISRLSQEVRTTSTPVNEIQELSRQIANGEYQPDPMETAANILLIGEEDT